MSLGVKLICTHDCEGICRVRSYSYICLPGKKKAIKCKAATKKLRSHTHLPPEEAVKSGNNFRNAKYESDCSLFNFWKTGKCYFHVTNATYNHAQIDRALHGI